MGVYVSFSLLFFLSAFALEDRIMKNLSMIIGILAGLFLPASSFAHHPVPHDRQTPGKSFGLNADRDDLLQFASGGHVIGFG
ncbi:hypothetical protein C6366_18335, partial [Desulfonatronum sp. SC1]